jgi:hypothetical protein
VFLVAYFILRLRFRLSEEGNHQTHGLEVFNHTVHKVMKDAIFYARIQANNAYYKVVLGLEMNKKPAIYLTEEQYNLVNFSKFHYIQYLILVVTWCTSCIFVQVVISWFMHRRVVYLEFCRLWSSPTFKVKSEHKRLNRGKDPKHRYGVDGYVHKSQRMIRFCGSNAIYMYVIMQLTLNYKPSGMTL